MFKCDVFSNDAQWPLNANRDKHRIYVVYGWYKQIKFIKLKFEHKFHQRCFDDINRKYGNQTVRKNEIENQPKLKFK